MGFLNKRKIKKSILYYISEIVIVVVGIFIAIQFNNFNENNKNTIEAKKSLERISTDLKVEKFIIERNIKKLNYSKKYLKNILYNRDDKKLDSIVFHVLNAFKHYPNNAEYVNLKYSGKLGLITNDSLRYNIVNYYEVNYNFYNIVSEAFQDYYNNNVSKYLNKEFPSDTTNLIDPNLVKIKLNDNRFKNIIIDQISMLKQTDESIKVTVIDSIISKIDKELKEDKK